MDANADAIMVFHRRLTSKHNSGKTFSEFSELGWFCLRQGLIFYDMKKQCVKCLTI